MGISGVVFSGEAPAFIDSDPLAGRHHPWTVRGQPETALGEQQLCPGGWALGETREHPAFAEGRKQQQSGLSSWGIPSPFWPHHSGEWSLEVRTSAPEKACRLVLVTPR